MSQPIMRSSFASDLLPIVRKWADEEMKTHDPLDAKITEVETSDSAYEVYGVSMGLSTLQRKDEGEALKYDTSRQIYTPRFTHDTWALGFKISMEMMQDGTVMKNGKRGARGLARAARETRDILAANIINNGYTSGVTQDGGDGAILFTASHTTPSGSQSNIITAADLSEAALETMYIAIRNAKNDRGLRANIKPVKLVINVSQEPEANRIVNSSQRVATADNDLNYTKYSGMLPGGIVSSPFLTDLDQFTIITDVMDGLKTLVRHDGSIDTDNDFDTKNAAFSKIIRISHGWVNFRGAYSSAGV